MNHRSSFFPSLRAAVLAGVAVALMVAPAGTYAQANESNGSTQTTPDAAAAQQPPTDATLQASPDSSQKKGKEDKVVQSKDTKKRMRDSKKTDAQAEADAKLPDRQLYDKALIATKKGHFDVARLDLQTLLNTYPDSQFQMKAKLAIADSWYREGGTAALTQAEQEYKDFITFFPNAPEAAEAQMRVGDIYFRQMDKPDRDYSKALHAQEEYRLMLQQFPDSTLVPQAKQRLREVQEVMATREAEIAGFYATHENWPATIARYQTVADSYPQFSRMDDVLVALGDAYSAEARIVRSQPSLPEGAKARLLQVYEGQAVEAYRKVALEHSASPHVEDARDRLAAMNLPIPTPTPEQAAASAALENSRGQYRIQDRARLMILRRPDTVLAAHSGEPPLVDAKPTVAPAVVRGIQQDYANALNPAAGETAARAANLPNASAEAAAPAAASAAAAPVAGAPAKPAAPLQLQDIPAAGGDASAGATETNVPTTAQPAAAPPSGGSNSMGVEVLTPGVNGQAPAQNDPNGGLKPVGPTNNATPPPIEKPAAAPDAVNDVVPAAQPAQPAQAAANGKKNPKPAFDNDEESSSTHKKKKGLKKLNPF
ncbi:outer membrane protein assembly factor BamD [Edaphobacter modestus]|uniref:Outer membrane protein assembly factor BamD n=1 Tax=Edaphobacter modestus TaxID=388466 RepID=A0A4Q7YV99_9BACT|nr:outer membrane protein assembly factor BamD [Edaphobacter modestus]RZU40973.1 outer membrane protein assembly factor BamD [Edaphobacter modestus]